MSYFTPIFILVLVIFFLSAALRILNEYERGVIFRLGRVIAAKGPGLIILIPLIDKMVKVSLRLVAMDVDPQDELQLCDVPACPDHLEKCMRTI